MEAGTSYNNIDLARFENYSQLDYIPVSIIPSRCDVNLCKNSHEGFRCKRNELEKRAACSNSPIAQIYQFLDSKSAHYTPFNFNGQGNIVAFISKTEVKKLASLGLLRDVIPIEDEHIHGVVVNRK